VPVAADTVPVSVTDPLAHAESTAGWI